MTPHKKQSICTFLEQLTLNSTGFGTSSYRGHGANPTTNDVMRWLRDRLFIWINRILKWTPICIFLALIFFFMRDFSQLLFMLPTRGVAHLLFHLGSDAVLVAANGGAYRNSANLFLIPLNYAHRFGCCSHDLVKAKAVATSIHRPQTIVVISNRRWLNDCGGAGWLATPGPFQMSRAFPPESTDSVDLPHYNGLAGPTNCDRRHNLFKPDWQPQSICNITKCESTIQLWTRHTTTRCDVSEWGKLENSRKLRQSSAP